MYESDAPIDLSLVAHIINDAHLKGTFKLEGNLFARTARYLDRYIASLPKASRSDALLLLQNRMSELIANEQRIEEIRCAEHVPSTERPEASEAKIKWAQFSSELANTVLSDEKKGGSVSLPGGWVDLTGGHAMMYLFKSTDEGLDFYIYNAGAGLQYHARLSSTARELYSPVLVYHVPSPIDKAKLTEFISHLLLAELPTLQDKNSPYFSAERLYEEIFPLIYKVNQHKKNKLKPVSEQPAHLRTGGQLSGTCSQAVLHQLLKEGFPSDLAYMQFIYKFKRYALDDYMVQLRPEEM
jgi:hypothetical protein